MPQLLLQQAINFPNMSIELLNFIHSYLFPYIKTLCTNQEHQNTNMHENIQKQGEKVTRRWAIFTLVI